MKKLLAGAVSAALALVGLGVATAAPATAIEPSIGASCSSLDAYLWDVPSGTEVTVTVDGETIATDPVTDSYYSHSFPLDWSQPHDWTVVADVPEGDGDDISQSGTTEPCASDPNQYANADATCKSLQVSVAGWLAESHLGVVVDGETLVDEPFDTDYWGAWQLDWTVSHTWSVTVDASDDSLDRAWDGVTTPCDSDPDVYVTIDVGCGYLNVAAAGQVPGTQATVTVDDTVVDDAVIDEWGWYGFSTALSDGVAHTWDVALRSESGDVVDSRSGTVDVCWVSPAAVAPEPVSTVTDCTATPADVVLPPSTESITYTLSDGSIRATANPGYQLDWQAVFDAGYYPESDTVAVLALGQVLRPWCALPGTATAQPVCDAGEAFLEYFVEAPEGALEEQFYIEIEGPNHGYDVIQGDAGFGHPFTGRLPWQELVTNADGTISPASNPDLAVTSVHVHFYLSVPVTTDAGTYNVSYDTQVPLTETANPCGTSGGTDDETPGTGHAFGRGHVGHPLYPGHPVLPEFPGLGVARHSA